MTNCADRLDENPGLQSCTEQFTSFGSSPVFSGRIRTVRCLDDTVLVKQVLAEPGDDTVLVIDGGRSLQCALLGDRTAAAAAALGWQGVVIFGAVRDVAALRELPLGVKALGTNPRKPRQDGLGEIDVAVAAGGVYFRPGLRLWSDDDGIVVEPAG